MQEEKSVGEMGNFFYYNFQTIDQQTEDPFVFLLLLLHFVMTIYHYEYFGEQRFLSLIISFLRRNSKEKKKRKRRKRRRKLFGVGGITFEVWSIFVTIFICCFFFFFFFSFWMSLREKSQQKLSSFCIVLFVRLSFRFFCFVLFCFVFFCKF